MRLCVCGCWWCGGLPWGGSCYEHRSAGSSSSGGGRSEYLQICVYDAQPGARLWALCLVSGWCLFIGRAARGLVHVPARLRLQGLEHLLRTRMARELVLLVSALSFVILVLFHWKLNFWNASSGLKSSKYTNMYGWLYEKLFSRRNCWCFCCVYGVIAVSLTIRS